MAKTCANGCNCKVFAKNLCPSCWKKTYGKPIKKTTTTINRRSPINKESAKRKKEAPIYKLRRALFLAKRTECELKIPDVCTGKATTIQHMEGRIGTRYLDESTWKASCWACNDRESKMGKDEAVSIGAAKYRNRVN